MFNGEDRIANEQPKWNQWLLVNRAFVARGTVMFIVFMRQTYLKLVYWITAKNQTQYNSIGFGAQNNNNQTVQRVHEWSMDRL